MTTPTLHTLEEDRPLSQCLIWPMIERYYGEAGPEAFNETPYYPTNNAYVAEAYAELILAYLEDARPVFDPAEPIYIVELASGRGVLPFLILRELDRKWPHRPQLHALRYVYVMTDFTEKSLESWANDELLDPYVKEGKLDRALFWPEKDKRIALRCSGRVLGEGALRNPPVVVANYFFDSIRHDYFQTDRGSLKEARIKVMREVGPGVDPTTPPLLAEIRLKDRYVPIKGPYYKEPAYNELLSQHVRLLRQGSFLFPIGGLRSMDNLQALFGTGYFLLASDKGFNRPEFMQGHQAVPYTPHTGSCSYMVNFFAIEEHVKRLGGSAWHSPEHPPLCSFAGTTFALPSTRLLQRAAEEVFASRHLPKSGYQISVLLDHARLDDAMPPLERFRSLLTCAQLACWDPWVFSRCGEGLHDSYQPDEYGTDSQLREALGEVERRLHPALVGAHEAGRHLRRLYFLLGDVEACLRVNTLLTRWFGEERDSFYYPAACHERRGEKTAAIAAYRRALELDPESTHAREGILRLGGRLDGKKKGFFNF